MRDFNEININDLKINPFKEIGSSWMLITAKKENDINTMTASWGGLRYYVGKTCIFYWN